MLIRLIGLGDTGEAVLKGVSHYFKERKIDHFLDQRKVVKITTREFVKTLKNLQGFCRPCLKSAKDHVLLRGALAHLFFGGKDEDLESRYHLAVDRSSRPAQYHDSLEEVGPSMRFFDGILKNLAASNKHKDFLQSLKKGIDEHEKYVNEGAELLGPEFLVTPEIPLAKNDFHPNYANIGVDLIQSVLEIQSKRRQLMWGLGTEDSDVDVVAVAFSLGDAFGGEGAYAIAKAIRRVLQYPEANRIVGLIGLGVYDSVHGDLDGRYVSDYLCGTRKTKGLDGLIAREKTDDLGERFGEILASIAMSSDPERIQIDNPDANQIQRDFGKSLVSCGYSDGAEDGAEPLVVRLYRQAKADLEERHCLPDFYFLDRLKTEVTGLKARYPAWACPEWLEAVSGSDVPRGTIERISARKVIAYVGHDSRLKGEELQELRRLMARDFPRARTVVYKYQIPEMGPAQEDHPGKDSRGLFGRFVRKSVHGVKGFFTDSAPEESEAPQVHEPQTPVNFHLALFVVDSFETQAVDYFSRFFARHGTITNGNGEIFRPHDDGKQTAEDLKLKLLARSVLSIPTEDDKGWCPEFHDSSEVQVRTCARNSILSGLDEEFQTRLSDAVQTKVGSGEVGRLVLISEAKESSWTVRKVHVFLTDGGEEFRKDASWFADVLCGLNWLCNEDVERRQVGRSLWQCVQRINNVVQV